MKLTFVQVGLLVVMGLVEGLSSFLFQFHQVFGREDGYHYLLVAVLACLGLFNVFFEIIGLYLFVRKCLQNIKDPLGYTTGSCYRENHG